MLKTIREAKKHNENNPKDPIFVDVDLFGFVSDLIEHNYPLENEVQFTTAPTTVSSVEAFLSKDSDKGEDGVSDPFCLVINPTVSPMFEIVEVNGLNPDVVKRCALVRLLSKETKTEEYLRKYIQLERVLNEDIVSLFESDINFVMSVALTYGLVLDQDLKEVTSHTLLAKTKHPLLKRSDPVELTPFDTRTRLYVGKEASYLEIPNSISSRSSIGTPSKALIDKAKENSNITIFYKDITSVTLHETDHINDGSIGVLVIDPENLIVEVFRLVSFPTLRTVNSNAPMFLSTSTPGKYSPSAVFLPLGGNTKTIEEYLGSSEFKKLQITHFDFTYNGSDHPEQLPIHDLSETVKGVIAHSPPY